MSKAADRRWLSKKYYEAKESGNIAEIERYRDMLLDAYESLVLATASRFSIVPGIELEDIQSACRVKLLCALASFDPLRGEAAFETYAIAAMRSGAKEARKHGRYSRPSFEKEKLICKAKQSLTNKLLREPSQEELMEETGLSQEDFSDAMECAKFNYPVSINTPIGDGDSTLGDTFIATDNCYNEVTTSSNYDTILEYLAQLPSEYRLLSGLLIQGYSLPSISKMMNINEPRLGVMRSAISKHIYRKLCINGHEDLFVWMNKCPAVPWLVRPTKKVSSVAKASI